MGGAFTCKQCNFTKHFARMHFPQQRIAIFAGDARGDDAFDQNAYFVAFLALRDNALVRCVGLDAPEQCRDARLAVSQPVEGVGKPIFKIRVCVTAGDAGRLVVRSGRGR